MLCQHYKKALIETAASGSEPQGDLRVHVDACAACRAAFEQEQSLFASIDAGLHVTANAEVPASLLPRVRARLEEESAPRRGWFTNRLVLASAAVVVVAFFAARAAWRTNVVQKPVEMAGNTSAPPQLTPSPKNPTPVVAPPVMKHSSAQRQLAIAKNPFAHETLVSGRTMPEVLVPRDQEVLLVEYAEQWRLHKRPLLLAQVSDATILPPLQVEPIQIAELDVKLLADEKSQ
jgi:hypothetical protein